MNILKPLIPMTRKKNLWGFDIETYGSKNKFLMGSIVGDNNIIKTFWDKESFIDFLVIKKKLFKTGYIIATNLNFDSLALIYGTKLFNKMYPIIKNSQMLCLKIPLKNREYLTFVDSWNFLKISLKKMGDIIGLKKLDRPFFLGHKPKNNYEKLELEEYNLRDSMITYKFMKFLQDNFNSLGSNLKITIASTSMDLFKRRYLKENIYQPKRNILDYLYKGYYGGRTEIIKRGYIKYINYYDVNSLYPSVMLNEYPNPNRLNKSNTIKKDTIMKYEGIAKVKIESPDLYIPYLPLRTKTKLIFPIGSFKGYYTFFELRKALELGYRIKKFYNGVIYFRKFRPFKAYVEDLYKLRKDYSGNKDIRSTAIKLCMNSLYGKFAQKIDKKETIVHVDNLTKKQIDSYDKIVRVGNFFIINEPYKRIPNFINPIFSIYTTAYARTKLYELITKNPKQLYYYDTDSLFTKSEFDTSMKLGELKKEFTIKEGILIKPKMYLIDDFVKCKGIHNLTKKEFIDIINGNNKVNVRRFIKFKEANRRKLAYNEIINFNKAIDIEDNKRKWHDKFNPHAVQDSEPLEVKT